MSFTDQKRREIKKYILRKIAVDEEKLIEKTMDSFGISITSVKRYLQDFLMEQNICESPEKKCGYTLISKDYEVQLPVEEYIYNEDFVYEKYILPQLDGCNENARTIWQYVCAEMLNNALEHGKGEKLSVYVKTNCLYTAITILDDGLGAFQTLLSALKEKGWKTPRIEDALVELLKGKITSAPDAHSGEGVFFSSKMMDQFVLWSDAHMIKYGTERDLEWLHSHIPAYASRVGKVGTCVMMHLENETEREIKTVFDTYADAEMGFFKTSIPVLNACMQSQPAARSQARRICRRLEEFGVVTLDFTGVNFMGQGFADEIFRVYAGNHTHITIQVINADAHVLRMIYHVSRGSLPENVILPEIQLES